MKEFNVIIYDFNRDKFIPYDVIPYFKEEYYKGDYNFISFDDFKEFVRSRSIYRFWSRCEYEIVLVDWPCHKHNEKWDVHKQIEMNIDVITQILIEEVTAN